MTEAVSMKFTPRLIVGLTIITLGLIFTLDNLEVIDAGNALDYWPLALVAVGLAKLADAQRTKAWISGSLWLFVGAWWTLWNLELPPYSNLPMLNFSAFLCARRRPSTMSWTSTLFL